MFKKAMSVLAAFVTMGGVTPAFNGPLTGLLLYLFGNGEAVVSATFLAEAQAICQDQASHLARVGDKTLVTGYGSGRVGWSLGHYWCHDDGTITDTYDFNNAPGGVGNRMSESKSIFVDLPHCIWARWGSAPSSYGKCLVSYGYGKPYEVVLKPK